ncbi:sterol desaturase family protein [Tsukamurella sp. 8F]|uniref:sterol desaturase family protein n=1 Tax=unclassified Tsukamurella TaxID=2633480 RepID=UPI0023B968D6|nr:MULTISPECIES: sterol desaturase family protein [unclassified Tsukamurella]MDF0532311.1 sterol desaturase family protein [Tsukamurella sp. 8J]MDF0589429.1 sterol desaturase family protein [Tsukamurella sp. 8F]
MHLVATLWENMQNPILYALPVFAVCIAIEAGFYAYDARHEADAHGRGYSGIDTRTSLSMGMGALVFMTGFKLLTLVLFVFLWVRFAPWHIPADTWWSWALLAVVIDLAWYCNHRFSHRVRIGWAAHQAHHSSEYFNLGTALRQKWNPWSEAIFWMPLPLLGFEPWTIYAMFGANLVYQFFSHTERVGKLWAPVEFVLNTPSHHRVHHGSDDIYLDRNYGGILIVWDRMFGTFQEELHTPTYGLTKPVESHNPVHLQYYEYGNIWRDVRRATTWRARLGYVFGPPGWAPLTGSTDVSVQEDRIPS